MRYFVISDVHGHYLEMIDALDRAGFNPNNPHHHLISLGDAIDRGPYSYEVMEYLVGLPNATLIRGNHEDMLEHTIQNRRFFGKDENGTYATVRQLAMFNDMDGSYSVSSLCKSAGDLPLWQQYSSKLVDYLETTNYVCVHGWIPTISDTFMIGGNTHQIIQYVEDWRTPHKVWRADELNCSWADARWTSGIDGVLNNACPDKTVICGHRSTGLFHHYLDGAPLYSTFRPYISEQVVAIDGSVAVTGLVNVYQFEEDN